MLRHEMMEYSIVYHLFSRSLKIVAQEKFAIEPFFLFAGLLLWPTEELCVLYLSRTEIRPKIITTYSVPNPLIFAAKNSVILAESSLTLTCYISYYFTPKPKGL